MAIAVANMAFDNTTETTVCYEVPDPPRPGDGITLHYTDGRLVACFLDERNLVRAKLRGGTPVLRVAPHEKYVRTWTLPGARHTVSGYSRAGDATSFFFKELNWQFGMILRQQPTHVFVTHCHADHSFQLPYFIRRDRPAQFFVPRESARATATFLEASQAFNNNVIADAGHTAASPAGYHIVPVAPGSVFDVDKRYRIRVAACNHSVPCVAYCVSELRSKLAERFRGMPGAELAALRRSGVAVSEEVEAPMFAFLGDTTPEAVFDPSTEAGREILRYPVVFTECTDLEEREHTSGDGGHHTCWPRLRPYVEANPETLFVLMHFGERHRWRDITQFFDDPANKLPNIHPWTPQFPEVYRASAAD
eukprot:m51a1_g2386 hypothetical protein (364) ;mRNA; f:713667-715245